MHRSFSVLLMFIGAVLVVLGAALGGPVALTGSLCGAVYLAWPILWLRPKRIGAIAAADPPTDPEEFARWMKQRPSEDPRVREHAALFEAGKIDVEELERRTERVLAGKPATDEPKIELGGMPSARSPRRGRPKWHDVKDPDLKRYGQLTEGGGRSPREAIKLMEQQGYDTSKLGRRAKHRHPRYQPPRSVDKTGAPTRTRDILDSHLERHRTYARLKLQAAEAEAIAVRQQQLAALEDALTEGVRGKRKAGKVVLLDEGVTVEDVHPVEVVAPKTIERIDALARRTDKLLSRASGEDENRESYIVW